MKSKYYLVMLMIFAHWYSAFSQSLDASPAGVMISHGHPKGGWMLSYNYMKMQMKGNYSGTKTVNDETIFANYLMVPGEMQMEMHMLMLMYGFSGRLSFMAMMNYNISSMEMEMLPGTTHNHNGSASMSSMSNHMTTRSSGISDARLWALYKLKNGEGSSLVASAGISFPAGSIDLTDNDNSMYAGLHLPYMMQTGSGSVDFMPGITYLKTDKKFSWSAQVLAVLRPFDNANNYHFGNELSINAWAAYKWKSFISTSLRTEVSAIDEISGTDNMIYSGMEPGANTINYGGYKASANAGINIYLNKSFIRDSKICLELGIPVYQNLNGPQTANRYVFNAGITKSF